MYQEKVLAAFLKKLIHIIIKVKKYETTQILRINTRNER
jgi:hypothetical protein